MLHAEVGNVPYLPTKQKALNQEQWEKPIQVTHSLVKAYMTSP